jgi:pimeloyl-ACP methyl ester carboxylesterase
MMQQQHRALPSTHRARPGTTASRNARDVLLRCRHRQRTPIAAAGASSSSSSTAPTTPRAVVILPGLGNSAEDYAPLADLLRRSGAAHVSVAPVERWNWALNALALKDPRWWRGELPPRPAVDWYIRRTDEAVREAAAAVGGQQGGKVTLLAHSAGGWIGRVYLRDYRQQGAGVDEEAAAAALLVDRFVSLGSPHRAPPKGVEGVVDQTRGILEWVETNCSGAHHHDEGVRYLTVAGRLVKGRPLSSDSDSEGESDKADAGDASGGPLERAAAVFAGVGYQQVCGDAEAHGDFIVPVEAAHLGDPRASEVDIEGVFHSPLGEKLRWPIGDKPLLPPWYGSEQVAGAWLRWAVGAEEELPEPGRRHRVMPAPWVGEEVKAKEEAAVVVGAAAADE